MDKNVLTTPTKHDDVISLSSESDFGTPQKPDVKRTRLNFGRWFFPALSRTTAEHILKKEGKEGGFVVRPSSRENKYTLSICHKGRVRHYRIEQDEFQRYFLSKKHRFSTIRDLIEYHKLNRAGLVTRLRRPPAQLAPHLHTTIFDEAWQINKRELTLGRELGIGRFRQVFAGKWRSKVDVAIKMMREGSMNEDDFIEEAQVMKHFQHGNLVKLYGVCTKQGSIFIVQELMINGCLLLYLRKHQDLVENTEIILDMAIQICSAMNYLVSKGFIHRDLAAKNCLLGDRNIVKVANFGMTRFVIDDEYTPSKDEETHLTSEWEAPEIITDALYSSKSDVWAYGILLWELWTGGRNLYPVFTNSQVCHEVLKGYRLERPKLCPHEVYTLMRKCWLANSDERPTFSTLFSSLQQMVAKDEGYVYSGTLV